MFCPNCGMKLPNGSKFCSLCGSPLEDVEHVAVDQGASESENSAPEPDSLEDKSNLVPPVSSPVKPVKKTSAKRVVPIVIAAAVVLAAAFIAKSMLGDSATKGTYVFLSNGSYELLTNLKRGNSIEIASSRGSTLDADLVDFSDDGKYVYYYSKYDNGTGTLCRAEYSKLKANSSKNDKFIEIIASNVSSYKLLKNGNVLYMNGDSNLHLYDGAENEAIAKSVNWFDCSDNNIIVYSTGRFEEGFTLYSVDASNVGNKVKLASNCDLTVSKTDLNNIVFRKDSDLYVTGIGKEPKKLAEDASTLTFLDKGECFYLADSGDSVSLYDYVSDESAAKDQGMIEPDLENYSIPIYSYSKIANSSVQESDYDELYTSCSKTLSWYSESWYSYSMNTSLSKTWKKRNSDAIHEATQKFIDKYADRANEDGFILVTDEVKEALKEISQYGENPEDWQWLWLCYSRHETGKKYDYTTYNADMAAYDKVRDRIELRESLKDPANDFPIKSLYFLHDGQSDLISDKVLSVKSHSGLVLYNTVDMITDTLSLSAIRSVDEVSELFGLDYGERNYFVSGNIRTPVRISTNTASFLESASQKGEVNLYTTANALVIRTNDKELYISSISNASTDKLTAISDDAVVLTVDPDAVYYESDTYFNNDGMTYGDLYEYWNGNAQCIARDVIKVSQYDDNILLAATDFRSMHGYELTYINAKGETETVADDVTQVLRVSENILLYISDGDLYCYDGKKKTLVGHDADYVWSKDTMETKNLFLLY